MTSATVIGPSSYDVVMSASGVLEAPPPLMALDGDVERAGGGWRARSQIGRDRGHA